MSPALRAREQAEARQRLTLEAAGLLKALRAKGHPDARVVTALATGEPFAEILQRARRAELVVLGRHGARRFRDLLLGSTAERVIRAGHVPVLIAAPPATQAYRRPLLAVDRSPESRRAAEVAARLLTPEVRRLDVIHVYETAHEPLLRRVAGPEGVAAYTRRCRVEAMDAVTRLLGSVPSAAAVANILLRRGDPRAAILSLASERRADLIAVGSHRRRPVVGRLIGSVAEGVVRHASGDALVVPSA